MRLFNLHFICLYSPLTLFQFIYLLIYLPLFVPHFIWLYLCITLFKLISASLHMPLFLHHFIYRAFKVHIYELSTSTSCTETYYLIFYLLLLLLSLFLLLYPKIFVCMKFADDAQIRANKWIKYNQELLRIMLITLIHVIMINSIVNSRYMLK